MCRVFITGLQQILHWNKGRQKQCASTAESCGQLRVVETCLKYVFTFEISVLDLKTDSEFA